MAEEAKYPSKLYRKYMHVEHLGNDEVRDILIGDVCVMSKIDGSNACVWIEEGMIRAGSRNRPITLDYDNQGFMDHIETNKELWHKILDEHPNWIIYGEWLVPHTIKIYDASAWRKFYVFDVFDMKKERYISYYEYAPILSKHGVELIPIMDYFKNPSPIDIMSIVTKNHYLMPDDSNLGEGVVIKNYDFVNQYGRQTWAKVVRKEFKEQNKVAFAKDETVIECRIAETFITEGRVQKTVEKINKLRGTDWKSEYIPMLLGMIYNEIVQDEMWNIVKKFKDPTINFRMLRQFVIKRIREVKADIF